MKILCAFGRYNYGDPSREEGYEYSNFIPVLRRLGHEVVFFETLDRSTYISFADLNRQFLSAVQRESPDVVFCVLMHYELWTETLKIAKRTSGAWFIHWATDDSWKYEEFSRFLAPYFDLHVTTSRRALDKARHAGFDNVILSQWAANGANLLPPKTMEQCRYPVSFVGSAYGNRPRWIDALRRHGLQVACFGHGWPNGSVVAEDIPRIIRDSAISLNFSDSGIKFKGGRLIRNQQLKARTFEVPGAGGMLMTEPAEELGHYYRPGDEIETFRNVDELVKKIRHYLSHGVTRDAVAESGYRRTCFEHTYEARFQDMFAKLNREGRRATADWEDSLLEFERVAEYHEVSSFARRMADWYTFPFRALWGSKRGPRAARRLLFEISWRLCGERTYSAVGLPGRLFYRES